MNILKFKQKTHDTRIKSQRKVKRPVTLGFFEKIKMKILGRRDGKRGLPKETEDGSWNSPHIVLEKKMYGEHTAKTWAGLQVENEEQFARLTELAETAVTLMDKLEKAKGSFAKADGKQPELIRLKGEKGLTNEQLASRRASEHAKATAPLRAKVSSIETELSACLKEIETIRSSVIEDMKTTNMISLRMREHIYARLDVYWDSALRKHPAIEKMPVSPAVEIIDEAETAFTELHIDLLELTARLLNIDSEKEVA